MHFSRQEDMFFPAGFSLYLSAPAESVDPLKPVAAHGRMRNAWAHTRFRAFTLVFRMRRPLHLQATVTLSLPGERKDGERE